jgi:hypothetical protein
MKFKIFWNKKIWKFQKNDNLKIMLPEDLFNMTNGHDLCRASLPTNRNFFLLSQHQCFLKTTNGQDQVQQNQRSRSACSFLSVPTYLTNQQIFKILIYFNLNYFSLSLSNSPMRSLSTDPTVKIYALLLPPTNCPDLSLSRSSATNPTVTICAAPLSPPTHFPLVLTTPPPPRAEIFWQQNPTVEICAESCHHQRLPTL